MVEDSSKCLENKGNNYLVKVDEVPLPACNLTCKDFPLNLSKIEYAPPEITVANYLSSKYKYVFKTENTFWWALQSLLYFEEIFSNLDYESNSDFFRMNGKPRDFFSETFYELRKHLFENKTFYLKHSNVEKELHSRFHKYQNLNIRHLIKEEITLDGLSITVKCIPAEKMLSIIDHINLNVGLYRKGLPDLFACDENGNFKLIEVKRKNEKISKFQKHWHKFLVSINVPVEIIRVGDSLEIYNVISLTEQNKKESIPDIESFDKPKVIANAEIEFGKSKSKKFDDLLSLITPYEYIVTKGENGEDSYSVKVPLTDIETLIDIYDIGGKWKSFTMKINDQTISKSDLVYHGLGCYRKRENAKDKTLYCFGENYNDCNFLGVCRAFHFC